MLYKNYTAAALSELERQRTDDYSYDLSDDDGDFVCCECKSHSNTLFNINSEYYCPDCICELLRDAYSGIAISQDNIGAADILKDIVSDFSDNELLCYVENRYEKIY
ncbi:MAG: hypothetical protein SOZ34_07830 [Clostridia bacterium]|nr:hypothetical protein [Clostridia bacterium]